jgi:hypothetical protein
MPKRVRRRIGFFEKIFSRVVHSMNVGSPSLTDIVGLADIFPIIYKAGDGINAWAIENGSRWTHNEFQTSLDRSKFGGVWAAWRRIRGCSSGMPT